MTEESPVYELCLAHEALIKLSNKFYETSISLKLSLLTSENTITLIQKYVYIFTTIKLINSSVSIICSNETVYHHSKDYPLAKSIKNNSRLSQIIITSVTHIST